MHICMVAFSDLRFDYRIFREATSLHQAGHRLSIVSTAFTTDPLVGWDDFEVHLIPIDRSRSLRMLYPFFWKEAGRRLAGIEADVYHVHDLDALGPGVRAAKRRDRPLVYDSHEFWIEQSSLVNRRIMRGFWSQLEKRLMRNADRAIAAGDRDQGGQRRAASIASCDAAQVGWAAAKRSGSCRGIILGRPSRGCRFGGRGYLV